VPSAPESHWLGKILRLSVAQNILDTDGRRAYQATRAAPRIQMETAMKKVRKTARQLLLDKPRDVVAVGPDDSVLTALRLMADKDISTVLVMQGDSLAGILSQRDYSHKVELAGRTAADTKVSEIMTTQVICVGPDTACDQCLALMHTRRIRHLPVLEAQRVIGVISNGDVLEELIREDEHFIQNLEHDLFQITVDTGGCY
jgi:CBS domain-containing protein